jgi:nucleoside-diphosphate-sugar epimerase
VLEQQTVLLVGGTGHTGRHVLNELLRRGVRTRAVVRSPHRLPAGAVEEANLMVVEADLLSLHDEDLARYLRDCDAVISCLGHVPSFKGVFGPPRDLVTLATTKLCRATERLQPPHPVKFILMSSVSVNHSGAPATRRGVLERAVLRTLRALLPPSRDNQQAADFLFADIGTAHPFVQWVVVRPDTLLEGGVSEYTVHEGLVSGLFAPDETSMANVAHFMGELVANPQVWDQWKGKAPVIVDGPVSPG